jgi:dihydroorotase
MKILEITRPDDWHIDFRNNEILKAVVPETTRYFSSAIIIQKLTFPILREKDANKRECFSK